uniref:NADH dehydrogenase subunit 4L n=1 Tax=Hexamermis agrotis TaxID=387665 RepID=A2TN54_9BILA|nr:NADH dehydrogenase subunit 4L [Hexamermis agrotis]ABM79871.1 NADH dehydrogenase subunit 4L [Hexamermis agrotis]
MFYVKLIFIPIFMMFYSKMMIYFLIILELMNIMILMIIMMLYNLEAVLLVLLIQVLDSIIIMSYTMMNLLSWESSFNWSLI